MKAVWVTAVLVVAVSLAAGCSSLPLKVKDAYLVPAGEPVGLAASTNGALVAQVEVDLTDVDIPMDFQAQAAGLPITGTAYLVFGAVRQPAPTNAPPANQ